MRTLIAEKASWVLTHAPLRQRDLETVVAEKAVACGEEGPASLRVLVSDQWRRARLPCERTRSAAFIIRKRHLTLAMSARRPG